MKDNRQIFNEAFFKKATYAEKRAKEFPQYEPVDPSGKSKPGTLTTPAFQVTDTDEVKKRLAGTFGVAFGNNNIKTMANRALKTFPIIISDSVEPETAVMLKKLMEEQYAEYINLLISNQVVNLSDFRANDEDGNIAIQALDSISGTTFGKTKIANLTTRNKALNADDIFTNIPLYNLLRENEFVIKSGDILTDTLLEGAVIVPSEHADAVVEYMLNEKTLVAPPPGFNGVSHGPDTREYYKNYNEKYKNNNGGNTENSDNHFLKKRYSSKEKNSWGEPIKNIAGENTALDMARGYHGTDDRGRDIYSRLTSGDVVIDEKMFDSAVSRTVGELISSNPVIKDKYEKASMLMQARRISGVEWYSYCTLRLGIPISDSARRNAVQRYRASEIRKYGQGLSREEGGKAGYVISKKELKAIAENRVYTDKINKDVCSATLKTALGIAGAGAAGAAIGAGAHAAATIGAVGAAKGAATIGASALAAILSMPAAGLAVAGALTGAGAFALISLLRRRAKEKKNSTKYEGWERVEYLIDKLDEQREEIMRIHKDKEEAKALIDMWEKDSDNPTNNIYKYRDSEGRSAERIVSDSQNKLDDAVDKTKLANAKKDYLYALDTAQKNIERVIRESINVSDDSSKYQTFNEMYALLSETQIRENVNDLLNEVCDQFAKDNNFVAEFLTEKVLATTTMPMKVQYVQKKEDKDLLMTPSFMARDTYAYGSTEIERKENKDRRYNQPLIMTVKFKERFSDGKYSDNELTAVIGILGKIIRVPAEEMEYVLKENVEGKTIEGFFKSGNLTNAISDMLSTSKVSKDLKSLPQSGDIWHNLERVATLAAANKITGKRNDNIANAHIVFSQREIDNVRTEIGVDYLKDAKKAIALMKRYSAFTLMIANDVSQRVYIIDDQDTISWNVVPFSALAGKDSGEQLNSVLNKMMRL